MGTVLRRLRERTRRRPPVEVDVIPSASTTLHDDLMAEYRALITVVSEFDGRLVTIKSWSVTASLAALGLGFQQNHYALFGIAGAAALCFWLIESVTKRHQMRYYPRMRAIEVALAELGSTDRPAGIGSSPLIDWSWDGNVSTTPRPHDPKAFRRTLLRAPILLHVAVPSLAIALAGATLFVVGAAGGLGPMPP